MSYDIFISYSRRDNGQGRITQLVERIKKDFASFEGLNGRELVPFFDQQEINGMEDWRQKILRGLRESRLLLACLSPAYLKSEYREWEFVEYLKYEIGHLHGFNGVAPIYFVEVPGWNDKGFEQQCAAWVAELRKRQHFDLRPWHGLGEEALREAAVQERMGKLTRQIVQTITRGERLDMSKPGLLDPAMIAKLDCGDWLHVLATTRRGENELHGAHRDRSFLAIDELPPDDALRSCMGHYLPICVAGYGADSYAGLHRRQKFKAYDFH